MEITVKELDKSVIELTVEVDAATVSKEMDKAFERMRSDLKVQGFRKGKVPPDVARQHISESEIRANFLEKSLSAWYLEAIKQKELRVISDPQFDLAQFEDGKPLIFKVKITVYPQIKIGDYHKIRVKPKKVQITDKEVEETIDLLRKQRANYEVADKISSQDDVVVLDTKAYLGDEELKAFTRNDYQHFIGEGFLAPGFDDQVTGLKKGDTKKFEIQMPDSYPIERYRKQKIEFEVQVKEVKQRVLPPLNDGFAQGLNTKDLEDLKAQIKVQLEMSRLKEVQSEFANAVLSQVTEQAKGDVPEVLVKDEMDKLQRELEWRLDQQGFTLENFLKAQKKSREDLDKEWRQQAEKIAKLDLVLDAVALEEKIEVKEQELNNEMSLWLRNYRDEKGRLSPEGYQMQQNLNSLNGRLYLIQLLKREKTKARLFEIANPPEEEKANKGKGKSPKDSKGQASKDNS